MALSRSQAAHLCRRVGFTSSKAELDHFEGMDAADAVEEVLGLNPGSPSQPGFTNNHNWWEAANDMRFWWIQRMIDARWVNRTTNQPSPLEEKLTLFWHSHFATGISKVEDASECWRQNNLFRNHGRGTFGNLLSKTCLDNGALLRYLDNDTNVASNPQENFARELMELWTTGPEHFTEQDVIEMTRAWTGHGIRGWTNDHWDARYEFTKSAHDKGTKVLFGQPASNLDAADTLAMLTSGVRRDETAAFIATKLWRFFVNDAPTAAELDAVVTAFLPNLSITNALRAMLNHPTFWHPDTEFALVRSPIELIVHLLRELKVEAEDGNFIWQLDSMGHQLFEPPSVAGWGTGDYWIGTGATWAKAQWIISLGWNEDAWSNFDGFIDEPNADAAADLVINTLRIPRPSQETRDALKGLWTEYQDHDQWLTRHNTLYVGALCPEMQVA